MKVKRESEVAQLWPTLSDPRDCSPPGSSVHGIFQAEYWSGVPLPSPGYSLWGRKKSKVTSRLNNSISAWLFYFLNKLSTIFEYLGYFQYLVITVAFLKDIFHHLWKETECLFLKSYYLSVKALVAQ